MKKLLTLILVMGLIVTASLVIKNNDQPQSETNISEIKEKSLFNTRNVQADSALKNDRTKLETNEVVPLVTDEKTETISDIQLSEKQAAIKNKVVALDNNLQDRQAKEALQKELQDSDKYRDNMLKKAKQEMQKD